MKQNLSQILKISILLFFFNILSLLLPYVICRAETDTIKTEAAQINIKDGKYFIDVTLEGGSGRAALSSPAKLIVKDSYAYAQIEWSSSNYDYMKIENTIFKPINTEGNSVFEIPVAVFDEPISIIADTTAMSMPHEISYTLTFHMDSLKKEGALNSTSLITIIIIIVILVILVICSLVVIQKLSTIIHRKNN